MSELTGTVQGLRMVEKLNSLVRNIDSTSLDIVYDKVVLLKIAKIANIMEFINF